MEGFPATGLCGLCLVLGRAVQLARLGNSRWDVWERMAGKMVNFLEIDGIEWRTTETENWMRSFLIISRCSSLVDYSELWDLPIRKKPR